MTIRKTACRAAIALAAFAATFPATASVDTSPKPGGVFPLKPGTYVRKGVDCSSAHGAAVRVYDGRGIGSLDARSCRATILSRKGDRYAVAQSCFAAGAPRTKRRTERQSITVPDALTFTLQSSGPSSTYRYCPSYMLPSHSLGKGK